MPSQATLDILYLFVFVDELEEDKFNVELVVQCVRMSNMPQTHHHALLLLGALAGIFPVSTVMKHSHTGIQMQW